MSKQNKTNEEPWSKRFGEDENFSNRQYSRSARHSRNNEVAPLYKVLLFLFLALLIIPFATVYWSRNTRNTPEPMTPDQVMVNKQITSSIAGAEAEAETSKSDVESRRDAGAVAADKPKEAEASQDSAASSSESGTEAPTSEPEEAGIQAPQEASASEEPADAEEVPDEEATEAAYSNTYTITSGDNLYRIALNHGMTLDELKTANGLTNDVAEIGTVLKVK